MINSRGWYVLLFLGAIWLGLFLGARHGYPQSADVSPYCQQIRQVVASVGEREAIKAARAAGASEAQIAEARKCLKH